MPSRFERTGDGAVRRLRFVPEDRRGLLTEAALASLVESLGALPAETRLVVLEGARDDLFAAGADLEAIAQLTPEAALAFADQGRAAIAAWESVEATTVAVVRGACFGGALDLVQASDLIVAFPAATFAHPGVKRGIVTGWGGTVRLARRLSPAALHRLFLEGEPVPALHAYANGLVDILVESDAALEPLLAAWAGEAGESLRALKRIARETEGLTLARALVVEERLRELGD